MIALLLAMLALVTPCPTEDSLGPCYWNDGTGHAMIFLPAGDPTAAEDDRVIYLD